MGLASLATRRARELSGGQQQRLALARAWALQPDILFLDEPTASLDPGAKREVEALVQDFAADGVTLVMSTHNLGQAKRLATRVAYLEAGAPGGGPDRGRLLFGRRPATSRPANSSKENCHGEPEHPVRPASRLAGLALLATLACARAGGRAGHASSSWPRTTSTEQSGLFDHLLPAFKQATGIDVRVVAVGTGQALDTGRRGDADVVFVHDQVAEEKFVAEGFGTSAATSCTTTSCSSAPRPTRPASKGKDIAAALKKLAGGAQPFVSRGDKSGTHAAELRLWKAAGVDMATAKPAGYKECGCGMGPALNMASALNAYVLTDRGTWLSFKNRGDLAIVVRRRQDACSTSTA